jgi:hypothetical protein
VGIQQGVERGLGQDLAAFRLDPLGLLDCCSALIPRDPRRHRMRQRQSRESARFQLN